jgi:poly-gamma-glutamate synthesis protein (capsule biosynthesis protein)
MKKVTFWLLIIICICTLSLAESPVENQSKSAPGNEQIILLSFVGDCSIGDAFQFVNYDSCYHATIREKGYAWPFSTALKYTQSDDLTIANLEVVFTNRTRRSDKRFNLIGAPDHVQCLIDGSVEMVNTVNNHAMDFYVEGYRDSLATLDGAGVKHFGTVYPGNKNGSDIYPIVEVKGVNIGFIGFTYPQESDLKRIEYRIDELKKQGCDLIVVSLHWGRETHMTPQHWQYAFAKKVINLGADLIWGHHPHVLQPIHIYKGKPIMYSTGNFTFGTMSKVDPSTGIFQFTYQKGDDGIQLSKMQVIPYQTQHGPEYRPLELTEPALQQEVFSKLRFKKEIEGFENLPPSFLENGIVYFKQGIMQ